MSGGFDELARILATPMPRGRALRTLAAGVAAGAFPALRPGRAAASVARRNACPSPYQRCFVAIPFGTHEGGCYDPKAQKCCIGPNNDKTRPNQMSWPCPKDYSCGEAGVCVPKCRPGTTSCGEACCSSEQECVRGSNAAGDAIRLCRRKCGPRQVRCSFACCQDGAPCCNKLCCSPGQVCVRGVNADDRPVTLCRRKCLAPEVRCNVACCQAGAVCCNKLCCAPGQVCVRGVNAAGKVLSLCRRKCLAPEVRCNFGCCKPG